MEIVKLIVLSQLEGIKRIMKKPNMELAKNIK
jgi:hypothetical protein